MPQVNNGMSFDIVNLHSGYEESNFLEFIKATPKTVEQDRFLSEKEVGIINNIFSLIEKMNAKTLLVENNYIDRDYIEDYTGFFARSFREYNSKCTRVHIFDREINLNSFKGLYKSSEDRELLKGSYLGFIVVKPLPRNIIGRCCLNVHRLGVLDENSKAIYREYEVNLFGLELVVDSLAFQEQDKASSACATNSIWTLFQITSKTYHHQNRSPHAITTSATRYIHGDQSRSFPNKGLSVSQMLAAIKSVGIDYDVYKANKDDAFIKGLLYSYIKNNIPCLIAAAVKKEEAFKKSFLHPTKKEEKVIGGHAVTVVGYKLGEKSKQYQNDSMVSSIHLVSHRIEKLIVHDDRVAPYQEFIYRGNRLWVDGVDGVETFLTPDFIVAPLYHKVRVSYDAVLGVVSKIEILIRDTIIKELSLYRVNEKEKIDYEWDIYLTTNNQYKKDIVESTNMDDAEYFATLSKSMPKYMWRSSLLISKHKVIDLMVDATDYQREDLVCHISTYGFLGSVIKKILLELSDRIKDNEDWSKYKDKLDSLIFVSNNIRDNIVVGE